jgi:hypothetical protein
MSLVLRRILAATDLQLNRTPTNPVFTFHDVTLNAPIVERPMMFRAVAPDAMMTSLVDQPPTAVGISISDFHGSILSVLYQYYWDS